jgi:hypothetical protein
VGWYELPINSANTISANFMKIQLKIVVLWWNISNCIMSQRPQRRTKKIKTQMDKETIYDQFTIPCLQQRFSEIQQNISEKELSRQHTFKVSQKTSNL